MAIHSSARNFMCPYCEKKFKTSVACRKHIRTHRHEIVALNNSSAFGNLVNSASGLGDNQNLQMDNSYIQLMEGADNIMSQNNHPDLHSGLSVCNFTEEDFLNGKKQDFLKL